MLPDRVHSLRGQCPLELSGKAFFHPHPRQPLTEETLLPAECFERAAECPSGGSTRKHQNHLGSMSHTQAPGPPPGDVEPVFSRRGLGMCIFISIPPPRPGWGRAGADTHQNRPRSCLVTVQRAPTLFHSNPALSRGDTEVMRVQLLPHSKSWQSHPWLSFLLKPLCHQP